MKFCLVKFSLGSVICIILVVLSQVIFSDCLLGVSLLIIFHICVAVLIFSISIMENHPVFCRRVVILVLFEQPVTHLAAWF